MCAARSGASGPQFSSDAALRACVLAALQDYFNVSVDLPGSAMVGKSLRSKDWSQIRPRDQDSQAWPQGDRGLSGPRRAWHNGREVIALRQNDLGDVRDAGRVASIRMLRFVCQGTRCLDTDVRVHVRERRD